MQTPALHSVTVEPEPGRIRLRGELGAGEGALLQQWFEALPLRQTPSLLELSELELADGVATTHAVNIVRLLLQRCGQVTLIGTPQLLAHNLYRVGLLHEGSPLHLLQTREEEPYG